MKKILIYMNKGQYNREDDDTSKLILGLNRYPEDFDLRVSFEPNPRLALAADIIFPRFEIPVKEQFLQDLIEIRNRHPQKTFINDPEAKLKHWKKYYLKEFLGEEFLPRTTITANYREARGFHDIVGPNMIIKPIDSNGGHGIEKVGTKTTPTQLIEIIEQATKEGTKEAIFQEFIETVYADGDKRVTIFLYEPIIQGTGVRFPKVDSYLCNLSSGGSVERAKYTQQDDVVIKAILPFLKRERITWAGVDIIGSYLGEINVSSPGFLYAPEIVEEIIKRLRQIQ